MRHLIHSEPGDGHENQDVVQIRPHPKDAQAFLCALADGQGGRSGGAEAAQIAVAQSLAAASLLPVEELLDPASWYSIVSEGDEAVSDADAAGYSTLVGLVVTPSAVCGVSCGDSAALLVTEAEDRLLTENQRKNPPVGSGAAYPVAFSASLGSGWKLLVMSDGVWKYAGWDAIARIVRERQGRELIAALRRIVFDANGGHLPDDFSVAVLQAASLLPET